MKPACRARFWKHQGATAAGAPAGAAFSVCVKTDLAAGLCVAELCAEKALTTAGGEPLPREWVKIDLLGDAGLVASVPAGAGTVTAMVELVHGAAGAVAFETRALDARDARL